MSDVVVSVTESTTKVTVTEQDVAVAVTETPVTVTTATVGLQGVPGTNGSAATITAGSATVLASTATPTVTNTGSSSAAIFNFGIPAGSAGSAGVSGVISVTSPITNTGSASSAILGINQTLLSLTRSQISDFSSGTVVAVSGSAITRSQVSDFTSGTVATISGSITKSQVSDFTSGTVTSAGFATTSGTAVYATTSGTSVSISGSITRSQVSDYATGTVANISGTVAQTQVTGLVTDLAGKASTSAPTITGFTTLQATPGIGTDTPITVLGGTGQSVPLQSWKTVSLVALSSVDQNGYGNFARVSAGQSTDLAYSAALSVNTTGTAIKGVVVRAVASQSSNIFEIQTSSGATATFISPVGRYYSNQRFSLNEPTFAGYMTVVNGSGAIPNLLLRQSSTLDPLGDQVSYQTNAGVVQGGRNLQAQAWTGSTTTIKSAVGGTIQSIATGANPLVTMASTHNLAVGDLVTLASTTSGTYDGTFVVATTPATTTFTITSSLTTGQASAAGTVSVPAQKSITSRSAATIGAVVKGAASQAVNLQEWQNSGGTALAKVDSAGIVYGAQIRTASSLGLLTEASSGGAITLARPTAAFSNPGANTGRLYFRDGTTTGTLKLVVRAGAAGAETTILDNIPQ